MHAVEIFSDPTDPAAKSAHPAHAVCPRRSESQAVNEHCVICAFVLQANRESPTSSCILARIRPVKIAPGAIPLPAARRPHRVPVCTTPWLSQYIDARFPTSASYFSEAATFLPYL